MDSASWQPLLMHQRFHSENSLTKTYLEPELTFPVYAKLFAISHDGPICVEVPVGFGARDFKAVCDLMHGLDPRLADYPDLTCPDLAVTKGTSAKALTDAAFDEEHLRVGAALFRQAAFDRVKEVRSRAVMLALASDDQSVQLFFERR